MIVDVALSCRATLKQIKTVCLLTLLHCGRFQSLLFTHDQCVVLKREPLVQVTAEEDDEREYLYERASEYGEDSIKIVRIQKTADPLVAHTLESLLLCLFIYGVHFESYRKNIK